MTCATDWSRRITAIAIALFCSSTDATAQTRCDIWTVRESLSPEVLCQCNIVTTGMIRYIQRSDEFLAVLSATSDQCPAFAAVLTDLPTATIPPGGTGGSDAPSGRGSAGGPGSAPGGGSGSGGSSGETGGDPGGDPGDTGSGGDDGSGGGSDGDDAGPGDGPSDDGGRPGRGNGGGPKGNNGGGNGSEGSSPGRGSGANDDEP